VSTRLSVSIFWLGKSPLVRHKDYAIKLGTTRVIGRVEEILRVIDAADLGVIDGNVRVDRHQVAECVLQLRRAIAFDLANAIPATGRFVIVDDYEIRGGGIVREALSDRQTWVRDKVLLRNSKWEPSMISPERRAEQYSQKATLLLVTGPSEGARKTLAKDLEARFFDEGRVVYFLGIRNVLYGVDADIERTRETRREHMRRLAEVAHLMLDAGVLLIVTAAELTQEDLEIITTTVDPDRIETVWVGDTVTTDLGCTLQVPEGHAGEEAVDRVRELLRDKGIVPGLW
jgi:bifunctional enzyme CysN/CysC